MRKVTIIFLLAGLLGLSFGFVLAGSAWASVFDGKSIFVCSGAGLMKPMNELIGMFEQETGARVEVHYGGSAEIFGVLATMGCDVFIPGAYKYVKDAIDRGYVLPETVKNIVLHVPVIAVPKSNPMGIKGLDDMKEKGVKVVLGDPRACAIGKVAKKILIKNKIWNSVKRNVVVFTPTVNQLLIYIATGQADATIIWEDMTTWVQAKGKIVVVQIPRDQNLIKTIPTAVAVYAKEKSHMKVAEAFNNFIARHVEVWEKWGFKPCKD